MNEAIGLLIIILGILAIAIFRQHKTILYRVGLVILFLILPLFAPGIYIRIIGVMAFFAFWRWRFIR